MQDPIPYHSIEFFCSKIKSDNIFLESAFEGCTSSEISQIETHLNFNLPNPIKEFLSFCGKNWKGTYVIPSLQKTLLDQQPYQILEESNSIYGFAKEIDANEIIIIDFEEHLGEYHWGFFYKKDKNENPSIYQLSASGLHNISYPFTQYVGNKLENSIQFSTQLFVGDYRYFELKLSYINPFTVRKLNINSQALLLRANELMMKLPHLEEVRFSLHNSRADKSWLFHMSHNESIKKISIGADELKALILPEDGLPNLESLWINSKSLEEIPKNLSSCPNLTYLAVIGHDLDEIPIEIFKLTKLKELCIHNIRLEHFPIEVCSLVNLVKISLKGNLSTFPEGLYDIPNLKEIDLSENNISLIDKKITHIKNLERLNICQNSFSTLELEKLKEMLPNVQITTGNQKPRTLVKNKSNQT